MICKDFSNKRSCHKVTAELLDYGMIRKLPKEFGLRTSVKHATGNQLFSYGIGGKTMKWIDAFLCFRQQRVVVSAVKSDWAPVAPGVP